MSRNCRNLNVSLFILVTANLFVGSAALEIRSIEGPGLIRNGSESRVVLDCIYDLGNDDTTGLVVKWYLNRRPFPVYQWIPNNTPQDLGKLKGRLDLSYVASENRYMKHRALVILNPTSELSGEYTCWVSNFKREDYKKKVLIIYSPVKDFAMTYTKPSPDSVRISCHARDVFPEPEIVVLRSESPSRNAIREEAHVESTWLPTRHTYNVSLQLDLYDYEMDSDNLFECVLSIPMTNYVVKRELYYSPEPPSTSSPTTSLLTTTTSDNPHESTFAYNISFQEGNYTDNYDETKSGNKVLFNDKNVTLKYAENRETPLVEYTELDFAEKTVIEGSSGITSMGISGSGGQRLQKVKLVVPSLLLVALTTHVL